MKTQISKWGNCLAVRIPKPLAEAAKLRHGDALDLNVEGSGAIRIRKAKRHPTLEELVLRITSANCHSEINWGKSVGKELW